MREANNNTGATEAVVPAVTKEAAERGLQAAADAWLETHGARGSRVAINAQTLAMLTFVMLFAVLMVMRRRRRARDEPDEEHSSSSSISPKSAYTKVERARRGWQVVGRLRAWTGSAARFALPFAHALLPWRVVKSAYSWFRGSKKVEDGAGATELGEPERYTVREEQLLPLLHVPRGDDGQVASAHRPWLGIACHGGLGDVDGAHGLVGARCAVVEHVPKIGGVVGTIGIAQDRCEGWADCARLGGQGRGDLDLI